MTHALSVGAVVAVRALDASKARYTDGLADVVAVDGDRAQLFVRARRHTWWFVVHKTTLSAEPYGPRLTWEAT